MHHCDIAYNAYVKFELSIIRVDKFTTAVSVFDMKLKLA